MIVTWIAIQSQPLPWEDQRTDVAYVACGERQGQLCLVRPQGHSESPALDRLLDSLERAVRLHREGGTASGLDWLRKTMPDQGTSIRLSSPYKCQAESYEAQVQRLESQVCASKQL